MGIEQREKEPPSCRFGASSDHSEDGRFALFRNAKLLSCSVIDCLILRPVVRCAVSVRELPSGEPPFEAFRNPASPPPFGFDLGFTYTMIIMDFRSQL